MSAAIICEGYFLDTNRNGRCTSPACDYYREDER